MKEKVAIYIHMYRYRYRHQSIVYVKLKSMVQTIPPFSFKYHYIKCKKLPEAVSLVCMYMDRRKF